MAHLLNHRTKEFLTIIVKITLLVLILTNLSCKKMDGQYFKVFGENSILRDCKINIYKVDENGNKKEMTLLDKGVLFEIKSETDIAEDYKVYISYQDRLINTLEFENVFRNASDQISHFYIDKKNETISIIFIGREAEIETKQGFVTILIPIDEYFVQKRIRSEDSINKEKKLFFDFYGK
jgi:hypothetical protein